MLFDDRLQTRLHEQGEAAEVLEDEAGANIARLTAELAEKQVPFEKTLEAVRKVPAKTRHLLRARYALQGRELRQQREAALREAATQSAEATSKFEAAKKRFDSDLKNMIEGEAAGCTKQCVDGAAPVKSAECMLRAATAGEVPPCLSMGVSAR